MCSSSAASVIYPHGTRTSAPAWQEQDFDATPGVCCSSNERRGHAMNRLACWLLLAPVPAALVAAPVRVARVGEFEGRVEVQIPAADPWCPAARNMPLVERTWVRSANGASVEMELDDGSVLRLSGDALCEFSDYTRLSTGQRISVLSIHHRLAYFTREPDPRPAV